MLKYFFFNGQEYRTNYDLTILEMIKYFNYDKYFFILEHNNIICNKKDWDNILIKNNDKIEIITIVGGG